MADYKVLQFTGAGWQEVESPDRVVADILVPSTLVAPSGASFPVSPTAEEWFWRSDSSTLYRRNSTNTTWEPVSGAAAMGAAAYYPHGFVNQTDSSLSFNDGTRQFTISTVGGFDIYWQGTLIHKSASENITITIADGLHYIYYDSTGTLNDSTSPWSLQNHVPVAVVYWNNTAGYGILAEERHMTNMPWATHYYLHTTIGTRYRTGFGISGYTLDLDTDAAVTFGLSNGGVMDEDIAINVTHAAVPANRFEQFLTDPAQIQVYYRVGASGIWYRDAATNFAFKNAVGGNQRVAFNEYTGGAWTQTEASSSNYVAYWIFATDLWLNPVISVQGQRQDSNLINARTSNTLDTLDLGGLPAAEMKLLYRIIVRTNNGYGGTRKAMLSDVTDYRAVTTVPGQYVAAAHASLGDLNTSGHPATVISTSTTNFNQVLSSADTTTQLALDTIDNRTFAGADAYYPHGFINQTDSTVSWNDGALQLTITPVGGSFSFFYQGTKYTKTVAESIVIANSDGLHFIYYNNVGALTESTTPWTLQTSVPVATVYWNSGSAVGYMSEERHMTNMGWSDRYYLHTSVGYQYQQGLTASGYTLNTQTDNAVTFGLTDGVMLDEDITVPIKHAAVPTNLFEQFLTDPAQIPVYYRSGATGVWNRDAPTNFWVKNTVGGTARVNYNQFVAGAWQQTEIATTNFAAYWIFATNSVLNPIVSVQGQREDTSLVNARANNTLAGLNLGTPPFAEMKLLYRFIIRTGTAYGGTRKFEISDVVDYRPEVTTTLIVPGMPASLIKLDVTNFNYVLSSTDTTVQDALQTTNNHNHGLKAGIVPNASFAGNPKKATVTFTTPYPDTNYAITHMIYIDGTSNSAFIATIENKTANGFDISLHTGNINDVIDVEWITKTVGE